MIRRARRQRRTGLENGRAPALALTIHPRPQPFLLMPAAPETRLAELEAMIRSTTEHVSHAELFAMPWEVTLGLASAATGLRAKILESNLCQYIVVPATIRVRADPQRSGRAAVDFRCAQGPWTPIPRVDVLRKYLLAHPQALVDLCALYGADADSVRMCEVSDAGDQAFHALSVLTEETLAVAQGLLETYYREQYVVAVAPPLVQVPAVAPDDSPTLP